MYIEILLLYSKGYIDIDTFIDLFYENIFEFEKLLDTRIYLYIISANLKNKSQKIEFKNCLNNFCEKSYKNKLNNINDCYVENMINSSRNDPIVMLLRKKYERKNNVTIDCERIHNHDDFINAIKRDLDFPQVCGNNWDAINDLIFNDILLPQTLVFKNWRYLEMALPNDTDIFKKILSNLGEERCKIIFD